MKLGLRRLGTPLPGLALVGAIAACGAGDRPPSDLTVRDSVGIEIIENAAPAEPVESGRRGSRKPVVEIGAVDGDPRYELDRVQAAIRLDDGRIVIANGGTQELRFYGPDGTYLFAAGGRGEGPGEFALLSGVWRFRGDSILAWDRRLRRLSVWTGDGEFGRAIRIGQELGYNPRVEGALADGSIVAAQWMFDPPTQGSKQQFMNLYRLSPDGEVLDSLGRYPTTEMMMAELPNGRRRVLPIAFAPSTETAVTGGEVVLGLGRRPEVEVRRPDGTTRRLVRWAADPVEVNDAIVGRYEAEMLEDAETEAQRTRIRDWVDRMIFAPTVPSYRGLEAEPDGRLWVQHYEMPGDEGPDRWRVFDATGRIVGGVDLPDDFRVFDVGRDYVLGVAADVLGVLHVRLYEIADIGV